MIIIVKDKWFWKKYKILELIKSSSGYNMIMDEIGKPKLKYEYYSGRMPGKYIMNVEETSEYIADKIRCQSPFFAGRFGSVELRMIVQVLDVRYGNKKDYRRTALNDLCMNAGFFPANMRLGERFVDLMLKELPTIDLHGIWPIYMEEYLIDRYENNVKLTTLENLDPFRVPKRSKVKPWSSALSGKKVLVVHPFAETIETQYYNHRQEIFSRRYVADDILPEFDLKTLKAVQTIAGNRDSRFRTWFEALDWMKNKCRGIDFDVAIIGCGAYGFPLAAEIKRMGKAAIHLGGVTQCLFGIRGKRWENREYKWYQYTVNESWVRPNKNEMVSGYDKIENGCYW